MDQFPYPRTSSLTPPMDNPGSAVAIAGDWHGNLQRAHYALSEVKRHGMKTLIHVGDFM